MQIREAWLVSSMQAQLNNMYAQTTFDLFYVQWPTHNFLNFCTYYIDVALLPVNAVITM